jgi:ectoine hydroxylase-related dioxygenase (phytanoyl-CoA dioxygenase family)
MRSSAMPGVYPGYSGPKPPYVGGMPDNAWLTEADVRLEDLLEVLAAPTDLADYPLAERAERGVLVYDSARLRSESGSPEGRRAVQSELVRALSDGPGLVVFSGAFPTTDVVDRASAVFAAMIADQQASGAASGDHFAKPGANDRVWNALEKLAIRAPEVFVDYYANEIIALVSSAWLGPNYQVTSQINVVNPGGQAQTVHRDYHLGFQTNEQAERYPAHVHDLSPVLTLQGAVAHTDMPVESGPTQYLPHSQKYRLGYLAWRRPEVREYFEANFVQLPLQKGDAAFFNPALFHAAGTNRSSDIRRMANLLQVSSAFGRAMESVDREKVANAVFPALLARAAAGADDRSVSNAVAAAAEGYSFPTNLDRDQPVGGLAPETQAELLARAVRERWSADRLRKELAGYADRRRTDEISG